MDSQPLPGSLSHSDPSQFVGSMPPLPPQAIPETHPLIATPASASPYASQDAGDAGVSADMRQDSSHGTQSAQVIARAQSARRPLASFSPDGRSMQSSGIMSQPGPSMPGPRQPFHNPTWQGQHAHVPHHHGDPSRHIQVARVLQALNHPHATSTGQPAGRPLMQAASQTSSQAFTPSAAFPGNPFLAPVLAA